MSEYKTKTVSGPIATFNDSLEGSDLANVICNVTPVQDLHGYDSPWPGGGGKNLFDASGSLVITSGTGAKKIGDDDLISAVSTGSDGRAFSYATSDFKFSLIAGTYTITLFVIKACTNVSGYIRIFDSDDTSLKNFPNSEMSVVGTYYESLILSEDTDIGLLSKLYNGQIKIMISSGSEQPTGFERYANICPIVGASSITVSQRGKNLLPHGSADTQTVSQVDFSTDGEGRFTVSGTATGNAATFYSDLNNTYTIKSGDYLHIMNSAGVATASFGLRDANGVIVSRALNPVNRIINLSEFAGKTVSQISVYLQNGATYNGTITPMIIHGATATTYEPYNAIADVTAQIGQTVYGGQYDFNMGAFTVTHKRVDMGDVSWNYLSPTGSITLGVFYHTYGDKKFGRDNMICDSYAYSTNWGDLTMQGNPSASVIYVVDSNYNGDTEAFKAGVTGRYLCYELATPIEITGLDTHTFETVLGVNNFWCNTGDITVEYYFEEISSVSQYFIKGTTLTSIANAIRTVKGTSAPIDVDDFIDEIDSMTLQLPAAEEVEF